MKSIVVFAPVAKLRVTQPRSYGQDAPAFHVIHKWPFAQALNHRIVGHDDDGVVVENLRDGLEQGERKIEIPAFPFPRQIVGAAIDTAILLDDSRTADADERR